MKVFQENYFQSLNISYENINKKYENYYTETVQYSFSDFELKEAVRNKDRDLLYKLTENKYKILKKQNINLVSMKFYLPDNTTLLNMNNPRDTSIKKNDVLIQKVNKNQKVAFGAEQGDEHIIYKSIHPMYYGNEYLGAVEFGINIDYILDDMKKYANIDGALSVLYSDSSSFKISHKTIDNINILEYIAKITEYKPYENIKTKGGNNHILYTFSIKNLNNLTIAKLYFVQDITKELSQFEQNLQIIAMLLAAMVLVTIILIHFIVSKSLKDLESSYSDLYEYIDMIDNNVMIVDTSIEGKIIGVSQRFCEISGYSQKELIGKLFNDLKDDSVSDEDINKINETLQKDGSWSGEVKNQTKDKKPYWLNTKIEAKIKDSKFICYNYIMHDITDSKLKEELVFIDELTKLYNRKFFNDIFPRMVNGIKRNGGCINFTVLNLDDFKKYNDIYGPLKGDKALVSVSETLTASLRRPDDYCFRLGGGEFGILFRTASEDEGYLYTQVLKKNIEMIGIKNEANITHKVITASFGIVSLMSDKIIDEKDVYKRAYEHLSRAKQDGRNKIVRKLI
ncbi:MAG: diguanylate cyclase [Sulfurimonas sp.]|nr:diguanylate cyclase [Sulfurimonas sp.]MCW9067213.1 diguanylate cyclase [Sulfurimonas sp.]